MLNLINGANDLFALKFDISLNVMTWIGRIGSIIFPVIGYVVTYRICLGLQHSDREVLEHGIETGIIKRLPNGEFIEVHQPLDGVDDHGHPIPLTYQGAPVPEADEPARRGWRVGARRVESQGPHRRHRVSLERGRGRGRFEHPHPGALGGPTRRRRVDLERAPY